MIQAGVSQPRARALLAKHCFMRDCRPSIRTRRCVVRFASGVDNSPSVRNAILFSTQHQRLVVIGAGKASGSHGPGAGASIGLPDRHRDWSWSNMGMARATKKIRVVEAGHPVPDQAGLRAGRAIMALVGTLRPDDLLDRPFVRRRLESSSLAPAPGISLKDKQLNDPVIVAVRGNHSRDERGSQTCILRERRAVGCSDPRARGECDPLGRDWK
jgi:glycerate 2-kinase